MSISEHINGFVDTMIGEQAQFENLQSEVTRREEDVAKVLDELENSEKKLIIELKDKISQSDDIAMQQIFDQTSQSLFSAISSANTKIKEAIKGMAFIQDFEKQFTVSVFGKVKAGKSYIGNFIMGQPFRKTGIASSYDKIGDLMVHVYDRGKMYEQRKLSTLEEEKECNGEEFYVNKSEATSTIQWVNIGGMCWFDTPGIGSVTMENEELAKEYVKNSDLVIFACNSDAAGTRQEFYEIKQLNDMKKPILLLLTQSDTIDYDVDEEGEEVSILIPKNEKDRKDQEEYMLNTLREQGMEDVLKYADILTVSALLATKAIEKEDESLFEQSNMGEFLDKLTNITKNEAASIKKNTPKRRINGMIDSIIEDLTKVKNEISRICSQIEASKSGLEERKDWMIEQIKSSVNVKILEIISAAKVEVERESIAVTEQELSDRIRSAILGVIQKVCIDESISKVEQIPNLDIKLKGIGDMKMRQDNIPYEYVSVRQVTRPAEGLWEKAGEFFLKKEYYTSYSKTETRFSTFDIGVNDNEIANNIVLQLGTVFESSINGYIEYLTKGYYEPIEILERKTTSAITSSIKQLEGMKM